MGRRTYTTTVVAAGRGLLVPVPFDPDEAWGARPRHHITGTVNGCKVRGPLARSDDGYALSLGPAWARDNPVAAGDRVTVHIEPEGPQRDELAPDLAAALTASPKAAEFFDALATFYRKGYLRWLDGATRRPELRAQRVAELIQHLEAGHKQRPR
jgi:hypothetical protein